MEIIRERQYAKILVIVGSSRPIDDDGSDNSITILSGEVAMIPGRAELGCSEFILSSLSGSNGAYGKCVNLGSQQIKLYLLHTFSDAVSSVILARVELTDSVPMNLLMS